MKGRFIFIIALIAIFISYQCSGDKGTVKQIPNGIVLTSKSKNTKMNMVDNYYSWKL